MKIYSKTVVGTTLQIFFLLLLLVCAGCEPALRTPQKPKADKNRSSSAYSHYTPVKIDTMPLTGFVGTADNNTEKQRSGIMLYVSLLDQFGCQIKTPGVFRFELYEYVQRSAEPRGRRLVIWPDIDLADASENNKYWMDFLRAYKFNLDFEPENDKSYILQVTCLCPDGKRLSTEFYLKHTE